MKKEKESSVMGILTPTEGAEAITENFPIVHLTFQHLLLWPAHITRVAKSVKKPNDQHN